MARGDAVWSIVDRIYDAALEADWSSVLGAVSQATGSRGGGFFIQRSSNGEVLAFESLNLLPDKVAEYGEHYVFSDPRIGFLQSAGKPPPIAHDYLHTNEREMRRSEYYDWIRTTGYKYYVSANFALDNDRTVYCAPQRTAREGPVSREQITVLAMLLPHLRRAVALQQQLTAANAYAAVTQALITQRNEAVFLCSGQGHLLHSNPAADELLRRGTTLRLANGGLRLRDPRAHRELYRLIARIRSRQGSPGEAVGGDFLVRDSTGLPSHICRVNPVGAGGAVLLDDRAVPRIMVLFASLGTRGTDGGREILGRHLGLTRRESELALGLADGLSLQECAHSMGITPQTARSYLKTAMQKSGARRQHALVRLVNIILPPGA